MHVRLRLASILLAFATAVAVPSLAQAQPGQAWGGGCQEGGGTSSCISLDGSTLKGDFYVNNFSVVDSQGYADLYICVAGIGCDYEYTVFTNHTGHYPVADRTIPADEGEAWTLVVYWNRFGGFIGQLASPSQFWAP